MTNREFAKADKLFVRACSEAGTPATARQASKWHRARGLAFAKRREAQRQLDAQTEVEAVES